MTEAFPSHGNEVVLLETPKRGISLAIQQILYADAYTERIAKRICEDRDVPMKFCKLDSPVFYEWKSLFMKQLGIERRIERKLPANTLLLGGNRWRHHYALFLSDMPIVVLDAHSDMSYDEMVFFRLVRPYNWIYFKLRQGTEVHLITQKFNSLKRTDVVVPKENFKKFHLYSFDKENSLAKISLHVLGSEVIEVKDPEESCELLVEKNKEISLDWDITRIISQERVEKLLGKISRDGDVCDIWLDEGEKSKRKTLEEQTQCCARIFEILDNER